MIEGNTDAVVTDETMVVLSKTGCHRVSENDLFSLLLGKIASPQHARVAAHVLFWLQFSRHKHKGRPGIYKEDIELAEKLGGHPKTYGRLICDLGAVGKSRSKKLKLLEPLFEVGYGPKPGQRGGRVRWIFATPYTDKCIEDAANARQARVAAKAGKKTKPLFGTIAANLSPQIAPTLSIQKNLKEKLKDPFSKPKEKELDSLSEKAQAEVSRFVSTWNNLCQKCNRGILVWRSSEVDRYAKDLGEIIEACNIESLTDDELEIRLRVLCQSLAKVADCLSPAFQHYNRDGLQLKSFVMYGPHLWAELEREIDRRKKQNMMKQALKS